MNPRSRSLLLSEEIDLLVRHFGIQRVRAAVAKASIAGEEKPSVATRKNTSRGKESIRANGTNIIESIREPDPEKYHLLSEFFLRLKARRILPESQDIRYFAQKVGLKQISGKSREDMVTKLMGFLMEQPIEKLRLDIESASGISEHQRQMGFSVLTEKLLGKS